VLLTVATAGATAVVEVLDRGPGIPPELRARLFQPFATTRAGGVGLGLAVSRRIVDLHGGQLELRDRADGGTCATMTLPGTFVTESNSEGSLAIGQDGPDST
jgi:signal transduction histidine kinase